MNFSSLADGWSEVQLLVYRENRAGDGTQPCGVPMLVDLKIVNNKRIEKIATVTI